MAPSGRKKKLMPTVANPMSWASTVFSLASGSKNRGPNTRATALE